jgi:hypothetical protein
MAQELLNDYDNAMPKENFSYDMFVNEYLNEEALISYLETPHDCILSTQLMPCLLITIFPLPDLPPPSPCRGMSAASKRGLLKSIFR